MIYGLNITNVAVILQNEANGIVNDIFGIRFGWIVVIVLPFVVLLPDFVLAARGEVFFPSLIQKHRKEIFFDNKSDEENANSI